MEECIRNFNLDGKKNYWVVDVLFATWFFCPLSRECFLYLDQLLIAIKCKVETWWWHQTWLAIVKVNNGKWFLMSVFNLDLLFHFLSTLVSAKYFVLQLILRKYSKQSSQSFYCWLNCTFSIVYSCNIPCRMLWNQVTEMFENCISKTCHLHGLQR